MDSAYRDFHYDEIEAKLEAITGNPAEVAIVHSRVDLWPHVEAKFVEIPIPIEEMNSG